MKIEHRFSFFIFQLSEKMNDPNIHAFLSTPSVIFHVKHHVAALDQLKHSYTMGLSLNDGEGESVQFREEFVNF